MQLAFDFDDGETRRSSRCERLFFGIFPAREATARIASFSQPILRSERVEAIAEKRQHVSLLHVRDDRRLREKHIFAAKRAAQTVKMPPFELRFIGLMSLPRLNPRKPQWPIVLIADGPNVHALHRMLATAMQESGVRAPLGFLPHLTLAYGWRPLPPRSIDSIRVMVTEFVLIHSEVGRTRYNIIDRWPLLP